MKRMKKIRDIFVTFVVMAAGAALVLLIVIKIVLGDF